MDNYVEVLRKAAPELFPGALPRTWIDSTGQNFQSIAYSGALINTSAGTAGWICDHRHGSEEDAKWCARNAISDLTAAESWQEVSGAADNTSPLISRNEILFGGWVWGIDHWEPKGGGAPVARHNLKRRPMVDGLRPVLRFPDVWVQYFKDSHKVNKVGFYGHSDTDDPNALRMQAVRALRVADLITGPVGGLFASSPKTVTPPAVAKGTPRSELGYSMEVERGRGRRRYQLLDPDGEIVAVTSSLAKAGRWLQKEVSDG